MTTEQMAPARRGLPTSYAGHVFRSRLEARFAVLFDSMGLRWEYEPEGFELPSGLYVPDFWLPDLRTWFEVKPDWADVVEAAQITAELCIATGQQVCIAPGLDVNGWGFPMFHVWRAPLVARPRPGEGDIGYFATRSDGRTVVGLTWCTGDFGPHLTMAPEAKPATVRAKTATFERPSRIPAYPLVPPPSGRRPATAGQARINLEDVLG